LHQKTPINLWEESTGVLMKNLVALSCFAVALQACGSNPMVSDTDLVIDEPTSGTLVSVSTEVTTVSNADVDTGLGLLNLLPTVDRCLGKTSESAANSTASKVSSSASASGSVGAASVMGGAAAGSNLVKGPDGGAIASVAAASTEIPTSVRVTFNLKADAAAAGSATEKLILEQDFPKDVAAESINKKSELKLRHDRTYNVLIEQLKADKVLQTTEVNFHFRKKGSGAIKLATSQRSGVSLRYGQGDAKVLRECPAGKFMSGIGFNEIPICRASAPAATTSASSASGSSPAPQQPAPQPSRHACGFQINNASNCYL
jgi:hypothetical protein